MENESFDLQVPWIEKNLMITCKNINFVENEDGSATINMDADFDEEAGVTRGEVEKYLSDFFIETIKESIGECDEQN